MSNNYLIDSLIYANIGNNLTSSELNQYGLSSVFNPPDPSQTQQYLNNVLDDSTIKRACCLTNGRPGITSESMIPITVRIPIPKNYDFGNNPLASTWQKFGYIDKTVEVPAYMCNQLGEGTSGDGFNYNSQSCQDFYSLYCNNMLSMYNSEVNALGYPSDSDEFTLSYKPECACFQEQPSYLTGSIPPTCYASGCTPNNERVFLSTNARQPCSTTICTTNLNLGGAKAGGNITFSQQIQQSCGNQLNAPQKSQSSQPPPPAYQTPQATTSSPPPIPSSVYPSSSSVSIPQTTPSTVSTQSKSSSDVPLSEDLMGYYSSFFPSSTTNQPSQSSQSSQQSSSQTTTSQTSSSSSSDTSTKNNTIIYVIVAVVICFLLILSCISSYFMFRRNK